MANKMPMMSWQEFQKCKRNKEQESLSEQQSKRPKKYHPVPLEEYVKASQWTKPPRKYLNQVKNEE